MIINQLLEDQFTVELEDLEDLIFLRPLISGATLTYTKVVHTKVEGVVKRKTPTVRQEIKMENITTKLIKGKLRVYGTSPKGPRTLLINPPDRLSFTKKLSKYESKILKAINPKKTLYLAIDVDCVFLGEISNNKLRTLYKKDFCFRKICFEELVQQAYKHYRSLRSGYFRGVLKCKSIFIKSLNTLTNDEWTPLIDYRMDWKKETVYESILNDLLLKYFRFKNLTENKIPEVEENLELNNVSEIYVNEIIEDKVLDLIRIHQLDLKVHYLPSDSRVNWLMPHGCVIFKYF